MLSGFNTNFRHRGVLFHVQTEDSGLANPHVITHLFHGGNIMASEKRDYSELLRDREGEELESAVRKLMEGLHKSMLKHLSAGLHDVEIETRLGTEVFRAAPRPPSKASPPVAPEVSPSPPATGSGLASVFGERVVSGKPLDEVVLDYLVENARKRRRSAK